MAMLNEKIDAFEKHVMIRQLRIGEILADKFVANQPGDELSESAFVILGIGLAYFEMIEQFSSGKESKGKSKIFFERGFSRVYLKPSVLASDITRIYERIRCGMYHTAMPTDRCGLSRYPVQAFTNEKGVIIINPERLINDLKQHFNHFCKELRDPANHTLRQNFETMFDGLTADAPTTTTMTATITTQTTAGPIR